MKLNLRNKFLVPTVIVLILGFALSGFFSYQKAKKSISDQVDNNLTQITFMTADHLESCMCPAEHSRNSDTQLLYCGRSLVKYKAKI